jgi:hypothetical protein
MKVAINVCFGGFGLSEEAADFMVARGDTEMAATLKDYKSYAGLSGFSCPYRGVRNDPTLIEAIETLGDKANGDYSELKVVEIPDGIEWEIDNYDGLETIEEKHRSWS